MILDYVADPDYFERYMSIGPTANDHFVFMEKVGSGKQMVICGAGHVSHCAASACENGWL